jgi:type II secretory pathway component PulK
LVDLVTVYSRTNRIDINTAPKEVLLTIPGLTEESVDSIIKEREEKPFKDINMLRQLLGESLFALAFQHVAIAPSMIFSVISTGSVPKSGAQRRIKAIVRITPRAKEKYQIIYWADDYPIAESLVSFGGNPWEMPGEELS